MNVLRRTLAVTLGVFVSVSLVAAPVAAVAGFLPAWACGPGASGVAAVDSGPVAAGRGGQFREPDLGQARVDMPKSAKGRAPAGFTALVDVYFHVVTNGAEGNLSNKSIRDQITVLNKTFGGREGGASTRLLVPARGRHRTNNAKWFGAKSGAEHAMKKTLKRGDDSDLNVYSTSGAAFLGWAYYPSITEGNQVYLDGIVIDCASVPGASTEYAGALRPGRDADPRDRPLAQPCAHLRRWLQRPGDFVADTPAQASPTSGCPEGRDTCPAPRAGPNPQLHGLLIRQLLHAVHTRPDAADA